MLENVEHITTTICGHCGVSDGLLLHSIRHRGSPLRLCSICVLRLHPNSYCPTCFTTVHRHHPSPPPNSADVTCTNCPSVSHSSCVGPTPQHPYVCPLCNKPPNAPFFELKKAQQMNVDGFGNDMLMSLNGFLIDENAARLLLAAATISSNSMCKAALAAKAEAERRAREAVITRKRAKHALEHMSLVAANEKMKMRKGTIIEGNVWGGMERMGCYSRDGVGNGGGGVLGGARFSEKDPVVGNLERLERSSNGVFVGEINAVECGVKGGSGAIRPQSMDVVAPSCSNGAIMDVHQHRDMSVGPSLDVVDSGIQ